MASASPDARCAARSAPIRGQSATCTFSNIPAGTYAVAVFHAEHNEARIETGAFGKPKQGYGFSGNPSSGFGPPSFSVRGLPVQLAVNSRFR